MNALMYAYLGDAIYEFYIPTYLLSKGLNKPKELQKESVKYVSATNQKRLLELLINDNFLTKDELAIVTYGRNPNKTSSKSCDIKTYRYATGFECLIGKLYYDNELKRIEEIMDKVVSY